jgi:hypothetical protein
MGFLTNMFCGMVSVVSSQVNTGFKLVERHLKRLWVWCILITACVVLILAGIGFILWGAYALLASVIGPGFAALIVGGVVSAISTVVAIEINKTIP